ncbi:DUF1385 domain-containing protein [Desulfosporosinus sp. PR]|uniref:DUF1385 domain-containing protein n=1 Tax=Candidatus Desulfosporosinus nitrosoreducens TaxID=3401928 RepID=UPI0027FEDD22|nr:DUF1385 domain-containing protein [Desulfosporosinus sp. PR]MDQ7092129.1 DUF1385 domain-containing protein [Desulfosporosinus sp. PR]
MRVRYLTVIGGRAHLNGITFATNTHVVRGKLSQGKISISVHRLPGLRIFNLLDKVPFLRGISKLLKLNLKLFLGLILFLSIPWERLFPDSEPLAFDSLGVDLALYAVVLILLVVLLKRLWQFHGAEHKAYNIYTSGADLSLEVVREASRISERCGTNMAVIAVPIVILLSFVTMPLLLMVVVLALSYEIYNWSSRRYRLKAAFALARLIQRYIVTAEPTEDQIRLAAATLSRALECDGSVI